MKKTPRGMLTYANVVSTLCLILLVGGGTAFAASQLGKNSVGTKQLKNSSVTGAKVKKHSLTGKNINLEKLGTVPSASHAASADTIPAAEATHVIGAPGQPQFLANSKNAKTPIPAPPAGFFKDHEGIVHFEGVAEFGTGGGGTGILFTLPPGFRPASGTIQLFEVGGDVLMIAGTNVTYEGQNVEGDIVGAEGDVVPLGQYTFRAGS